MLPLLAAVAAAGVLSHVLAGAWAAAAGLAAVALLAFAAISWWRLHRQVSVIANEWQITVDTVDFPLVTVDAAGRVVRMNRSAMELTGRPYRGNLGRPLAELGAGEPWGTAAGMLSSVAAGETATRQVCEEPGAAPAGDDPPPAMFCEVPAAPAAPAASAEPGESAARHWEVSVCSIPEPGSGRPGFVVLGRDVGERVRLEERLRRRELMSTLGSLVGSVAHEVRGPLYALGSSLDGLERRHGGRAELAPYLPVLRGSVDHLRALMAALLDYGKPIGQELRREPLAPLAEEARRACAEAAAGRQVAVEVDVDPGLPAVEMDRERLFGALRNLLENAVQHTPDGGRVTLRARPVADWVEVEVADTGPGFRHEDLPRLFDPFFSRRSGGTGLGLAIVRRVVEQHGGEVAAANQPGGGASVRLWLPLRRAAA
jgi:nitrogen-specific signal transduction histidine kinase